MIVCVLVNFNCLNHTKNLINDLEKQQYKDFKIVLYDQGSVESGTEKYLNELKEKSIVVIQNGLNKPLNHIWNESIRNFDAEYFSFLNNDIRIPSNFICDTVHIFERENNVSCVIHPTNKNKYNSAKKELEYEILTEKARQGWDFSVRKSDWVEIPNILEFYCGDDFIFENIFRNNKQVAVAISSPIIHHLSQTRKSKFNSVIPNRNPKRDVENYKKLGFPHYLDIPHQYSKLEPDMFKIREYNHE